MPTTKFDIIVYTFQAICFLLGIYEIVIGSYSYVLVEDETYGQWLLVCGITTVVFDVVLHIAYRYNKWDVREFAQFLAYMSIYMFEIAWMIYGFYIWNHIHCDDNIVLICVQISTIYYCIVYFLVLLYCLRAITVCG